MRKPFYGWIIVGVTFLIGVTESGAFQNILAVFMKPMAQDFGWSRAAVTGSIAFGSLFAGVVSPLVGPVLDRHGPRMVAFWGILILSAGLIGMTFASSIWQLYLFFGIGRMVAVGALGMVISVSVSNWFIRKRGRALGITWLGPQFGTATMPALTQFLILYLGWRLAWSSLGTIVFLLSGIPALLFLKRRPEDMGLLPDGAASLSDPHVPGDLSAKNNGADAAAEDSEPAWTRAQATRTLSFWMLTCMDALISFQNAGINFHVFPFLTDRGIPDVTAVFVLSTIAVFGAIGSVAWGVFAERFRAQALLSINFLTNGMIFLLLYWSVRYQFVETHGVWIVFVLAALHGFNYGGRQPMATIIWAGFFGRKSLGAIYGFSTPFRYTANAISPIFAAFCFDIFGTYAFPFYFYVGTFFVACIVSLNLKSPGFASPPSAN